MRFQFKYKNHRGEVEERDVDIVALEFDFMCHPEFGYQPGWCISGWDYSRDRLGTNYRSFHLSHMILNEVAKNKFTLLRLPFERHPKEQSPVLAR